VRKGKKEGERVCGEEREKEKKLGKKKWRECREGKGDGNWEERE
jgi:hypothetical protein